MCGRGIIPFLDSESMRKSQFFLSDLLIVDSKGINGRFVSSKVLIIILKRKSRDAGKQTLFSARYLFETALILKLTILSFMPLLS